MATQLQQRQQLQPTTAAVAAQTSLLEQQRLQVGMP
tara:strand:+ start:244 stop:351 length:108 start_codon:yes stop_codon:yes gene_type:complete